MIFQLPELIPMQTPLGDGYAILVEGGQHDQYWTIALSSGALVTFRQDQIRIASSYTHGRGMSDARMKKVTDQPLKKAKDHGPEKEESHDRRLGR